MLKVMSRDHRSVPLLLCCDSCGSWIDDIGHGAAVFVSPSCEGDAREVRLAHKGACHDAIEARLRGEGHVVGWQELRRFLLDALHNGGLTFERIQEAHQREQDIGGWL